MPRTLSEILASADELAARFESEEFPGPGARQIDPAPLIAVRDAFVAQAQAAAALADAVEAARAAGFSWPAIASMTGTSAEAVRQRYGSPAAR